MPHFTRPARRTFAVVVLGVLAWIAAPSTLRAADAPVYARQWASDVVFTRTVVTGSTTGVTLDSTGHLVAGQAARVYLRCGDIAGCTDDPDVLHARVVQIAGVTGNAIAFVAPLEATPPAGAPFESILYFPGNASSFAGSPGNPAAVYVADSYNHRIVAFDAATGVPVRVIGAFGTPWRVDWDIDGYPDESGVCIDVWWNTIDPAGCTHNPWDQLGAFFLPSDVTVTTDGTLIVADTWNYRIQILTPDPAGTVVASDGQRYRARAIGGAADSLDNPHGTWGRRTGGDFVNPGAGFMSSPFGVAVTPAGDILLADTENNRIQIFRAVEQGEPCAAGEAVAGTSDTNGPAYCARAFGDTGEGAGFTPHELDLPIDVSFDASRQRIIVADSDNNRVHVYDATLTEPGYAGDPLRQSWPKTVAFLGRPGSDIGSGVPGDGIADGWEHIELYDPWAVTTDSSGRLIVADSSNHRLQIVDAIDTPAAYAFVGTVGVQETTPPIPGQIGLNFPAGITVGADGALFVVDSGRGRLQKLVAAALQVSDASVSDALLTVGESTTVSFTLTNTGAVPIDGVLPLLDGALFASVGTIAPAGPQSIAPGASVAYAGTLTFGAPGVFAHLVSAGGASGGVAVLSADVALPEITVEAAAPPAMAVDAITVTPALAAPGTNVTVDVRITNVGSTPLDRVRVTVFASAPLVAPANDTIELPAPLTGTATVSFTFTPTADGTTTFSARATACAPCEDDGLTPADDRVSVEAWGIPASLTVQGDLLPPVAQATVLGHPRQLLPCLYGEVTPGTWQEVCSTSQSGWFRFPRRPAPGETTAGNPDFAPVVVSIAASDPSGIRRIEYRSNSIGVGGGVSVPTVTGAQSWSFPIALTGEGPNIIAFWAVDGAGSSGNVNAVPTGAELENVSLFCARVPAQCVTVNIDPVPPSLNEVPPVRINDLGTQARLRFTAHDGHSTVARVFLAPGQPGAALEMPTSLSQGDLVLTGPGASVRGTIVVVDRAGHMASFPLPVNGGRDIRLDPTPPEGFNRLDPSALGVTCVTPGNLPVAYWCTNKLYGTDNLPGFTTAAIPPSSVVRTQWGNGDFAEGEKPSTGGAELHTYVLSDEYVPSSGQAPIQTPNRTTIVEKVGQSGSQVRVRVMSIQYQQGALAGPVIVPDWAYKKYEWGKGQDGALKRVNQKYELHRGQNRIQVIASYDVPTNVTTIHELGPHPERKTYYAGLVLLRMVTDAGRLRIVWDGVPIPTGHPKSPTPDRTAPKLKLPGGVKANATSPAGATVTFAATASDDQDSDVAVVCVPASGSIFAPGLSTASCSASDDSGNTATGSFQVKVSDIVAPTIAVPADLIVPAVGSAGAPVTFVVTASDDIDPVVSVGCLPASGATFPLGTSTVTCRAADGSGNLAKATFRITVVDMTAPVLTVPANITVTATSSAGANVSYAVPVTDDVDRRVTVQCAPKPGRFPIGTTTVTCSASDRAGNTAHDTFTVTVINTRP